MHIFNLQTLVKIVIKQTQICTDLNVELVKLYPLRFTGQMIITTETQLTQEKTIKSYVLISFGY